MRGLARYLLVGLLVLMLPLKGMAAATHLAALAHPGALHERAAAAAEHGDSHPCHDAARPAAHADGETDGESDAEADAKADAPDSPSPKHCPHCATCCAPMLPAAAVPLIEQATPAPHPPVTMALPWLTVALPLPDRPPRTLRV